MTTAHRTTSGREPVAGHPIGSSTRCLTDCEMIEIRPRWGDRSPVAAMISVAGAGFAAFLDTPGCASLARVDLLIAAPRLTSIYFTASYGRGSEVTCFRDMLDGRVRNG